MVRNIVVDECSPPSENESAGSLLLFKIMSDGDLSGIKQPNYVNFKNK